MLTDLLSEIDQNSCSLGRKAPSDQFFSAGDVLCGPYKVLGIIDVDIEEESKEFSCEVHGCVEKLASLADLEQHYNTFHRFECSECKKHLKSAHLLDLHLCEAHDSFFELQSAKKAMFSCFVAECAVKSWDSKERMSHCVQVHNFPSNFRYDESHRRNPNANSMEVDSSPKPSGKKKKKKKPAGPQQEVALPSLGGGGRRGRGRFAPGWHQRQVGHNSSPQPPTVIDMQELEEALP